MSGKPNQIHYLKDYQPPSFLVETIHLHFKLDPDTTEVHSRLFFTRNPNVAVAPPHLRLDGRNLELCSVVLNANPLRPDQYQQDEEGLTIFSIPDHGTLETTTRIHPRQNTSLEGLFCSGEILCTQCEPEGLRKITFFLDRPDVMSRYQVTLEAKEGRYNTLLSNGNLEHSTVTQAGTRITTWRDPFKKPSYLFALVAGNLHRSEDRFTTCTGREIALHLYVEPENHDKCQHALMALKKSMAWDERRFGREYDLDLYMIVAVNDFNMGAMENKGLNLFNAKYVLALPETATDIDYQQIESVIAHEYFHNWTGNRVTCRDWFQLSLKEGLTVYRDQEFSAQEVTTTAIQRIDAVRLLRSNQFPEDAGPTAHPVQPDSYMEINNFYTMTVYNKGAEVVRMLATLLGPEGFRRGMDLYFERHDGQAVTVEDFLRAMADANGRDLTQFSLWYRQAGTPVVEVVSAYDAAAQTFSLTLTQHCPPSPGQKTKAPFHIPVMLGLLDRQGNELPLHVVPDSKEAPAIRLLELVERQQTFQLFRVPSPPVFSVFRNFSAPIRLKTSLSEEELAFLWCHDTDGFNRWEGGQALATQMLLRGVGLWQEGETWEIDPLFVQAFRKILTDPAIPPMEKAMLLTLPDERYLLDQMDEGEPEGIFMVRRQCRRHLAQQLIEEWSDTYHRLRAGQTSYDYHPEAVGQRALKNLSLDYLLTGDCQRFAPLAVTHYEQSHNMTDRLAPMVRLVYEDHETATGILDDFQRRWYHDPLVMDKWFAFQAMSPAETTLARVRHLMEHPLFSIKNPNKVRSLIGAFCHGNPVRFHAVSGEGYLFLADRIAELNTINPQVAARLLTALVPWRRFEPHRRQQMRQALATIANLPDLARDLYELVQKSMREQ
ncbi:MAG: aminopeptidase N [Magnetococcales bacterium]|nr:aminopeptidase N [Magnetococcales bacterium]MBF0149641.1 aminopeptidase N [Magnetococcales bacterium]MBF0631784.1 aminopeptidase N [Magnetococcales bacterium]